MKLYAIVFAQTTDDDFLTTLRHEVLFRIFSLSNFSTREACEHHACNIITPLFDENAAQV